MNRPPSPPTPRRGMGVKVKFFIYDAILLKFETQYFDMFANDNWDSNLWMEVTLPLKKVKFCIYCAILMKFETTFSYVYQ